MAGDGGVLALDVRHGGQRPAGGQFHPRDQLCTERERCVELPCAEPADPRAGRADAVRGRAAHAAAARAAGALPPGRLPVGVADRPALDPASAANRGDHLRRPAGRVTDGIVFSADLLLFHPLGRVAPAATLAGPDCRRLPAGHGDQGGHGHRSAPGAALRPRVRGRFTPRGLAPPPGAASGSGGDLAAAALAGGGHGLESRRHGRLQRRGGAVGVLADAIRGGDPLSVAIGLAASAGV